METRTSLGSPLRIATIPAGSGRIGISLCPGKHQDDAITGSWARDLATDLDVVREWGAAAVVTLVEAHELTSLKVGRLGEEVVERGMAWLHLPIPDVTAPGPSFEATWPEAGATLHELLTNGQGVFIHCKGGLGRAGTVAARLLVELGSSPDAAIANVRAVRRGAIQTYEQEAYVRALTPGAPETTR